MPLFDPTHLYYNKQFAYQKIMLELITEVSPHYLRNKMAADQYTLIDVRTQESYDAGHIPGAINLPFQKETNSFLKTDIAPASVLSPSKINIFYCYDRTCDLSSRAALAVSCIGRSSKGISTYAVAVMLENWDGWLADKGPIEVTPKNTPTAP